MPLNTHTRAHTRERESVCLSCFMQIRCNFFNSSYLSETQKNTFQFLAQSQ